RSAEYFNRHPGERRDPLLDNPAFGCEIDAPAFRQGCTPAFAGVTTVGWGGVSFIARSDDAHRQVLPQVVANAKAYENRATVSSTSTAAPWGRAATPMAERAWRPASPKML